MKEFKVGDWVTWNGSCSGVRMYVGQVVKVNELSYDIVDNEWYATSEVSKKKVRAFAVE